MHQKKKLLFVIESLTLAGSEKSLIALLSNLNPALYDIDLQLFKFGNELEKFIPDYVNLLPEQEYITFASNSWKDSIKQVLSSTRSRWLVSKVVYSIKLRMRSRNHSEVAKVFWETVGGNFSTNDKQYDVAIAFAQGVPTFFCD